MFEATVLAPGSCGELVQGTREGIPFHISCPIDLFSRVTLRLTPTLPLITPASCPKAAAALKGTLKLLRREGWGGSLAIASPLPRAKGMASSTADVMGAVDAAALALGHPLPREDVARLALDIEPSDGTLFSGVVLFDHRGGRLLEPLSPPPPLDILVLDFGGEVDTLEFNRVDRRALLRSLEPQANGAVALVKEGFQKGDPALIGQGATLSAMAYQQVLFKEPLEKVIALSREVGAVGVNVAHSGTVIGLLLDPRRTRREEVAAFLRPRLPGLEGMFLCSLIGGGSRPVKERNHAPAGSGLVQDKALK